MKGLGKLEENKLDAKFFSTETGKLVILLGLLLVAGIVYFFFYAGSGDVVDPVIPMPADQSNPSPTSNNAAMQNSSMVAVSEDEQSKVTSTATVAAVKDVFKPLAGDEINDNSHSAGEIKAADQVVNYDIPDVPQPPKPKPKADEQPDNENRTMKDSQVTAQEPKKSIEQLIAAKVTGIVGAGEMLMAIMEVDGKSEAYRKGDILKDEIKVGDITSHSVILVKDNEKLEIQLGGK